MIPIMLYEKGRNRTLFNLLEKNLPHYLSVIPSTGSGHNYSNGLLDIFWLDQSSFRKNVTETCLLILNEHIKLKKDCSFPRNTVALVLSSDSEQVKNLSKHNVNTIVCGLSPKDTVTFSSIRETEASVSLQRSIQTLFGSIVEPFEISVKFEKNYSPSCVLLFIALLLITGVLSVDTSGAPINIH